MQRIDHQTADSDLFGVGKPGFTGGDTTTGVPSTRLTPDWCNAVQEEIARAVEAAGITLDPDNHAQLAQAITAMVASGAFSGKWSDLTGKPAFATVATTGAWADLSGKPVLATVAVSGSYADLGSKPDLTALSGYAKTTTGAKVEAFDMYSADLNAIENTPGIVVTECSDTVTNRPSQITSNSLLLQIADGGGNDIRAQWLLSPSGSSVYQRIKWGGGLPGNWSAWCTIWSSANDGAGSGLDADQLDGLHASQITGAVKKYLVLDQYNGNIIRNSLGISSITDHAVGQYTVSFTTPWPYIYYVPASCTVGDTGNPDCAVIEDEPSLQLWTTSQIRMAHKVSGTGSYVDGRPDTLIFAGM